MSQVERFREQHAQAVVVVQQISALLNPVALAADATKVRHLLSQLVGALQAHLAMEDSLLYPKLIASSDAKVSGMAKRFQQEMGGIKDALGAYVKKWPSAVAIQQNPALFIADTRGIFAALAKRIEKEDKELYVAAAAML